MATKALSTSAWIIHHGNGCPLPKGTLIDVRLHNGEVLQRIAVGGVTVGLDGSIISRSRGRWNAWDYSDGGPMAPKFKAYRICEDAKARNAAMFASWLDIRELEVA